MRNVNAVSRKLRLALIKATYQKLEVAKDKRRKKEKRVEKRKTKAKAAKCQKAKRRTSLSSEKEENYENDTGDKMNLD